MYAIIADGGRQYKVVEGQELEIDYRDIPQGDQLTFDRVLALSGDSGLKLGQPTVAGATRGGRGPGADQGREDLTSRSSSAARTTAVGPAIGRSTRRSGSARSPAQPDQPDRQ